MRALTAFLERELLALLQDAPPPASHDVDGSEDSESQSQSQSQSQLLPAVAASQLPRPRVVAVSRTCAAEQRLTLVDRAHSLDAFVPQKVLAALAGLRGSVVRIERYHFATPRRVAALALTAAEWAAPKARVCLWVCAVVCLLGRTGEYELMYGGRLQIDELSVIDKSDLAVNAAPAADESTLVAALLREMDDDLLETRLATRQGLPPLPAPPVVTCFDDANPLQDEDCVIPEDQEAQLEAQDGWGLPAANQQTDSQLIAENESGLWTQSQVGDVEQSAPVAHSPTQDKEAVVSVIVDETEAEPSRDKDDSQSVAESQGFQFLPEDVSETFIHCSDTESDSDNASTDPSQQRRQSERKRKESASQDVTSDAATNKPNSASEGADGVSNMEAQPQVPFTAEQQPQQIDAESVEPPEVEQVEESPSESQPVDDVLFVESQQESTQIGDDIGFHDAGVEATQYASQATQGDFVTDMSGEGGFPQTQAPDTQDGFADLDDVTTDATESQTQMPIEEMDVAQDNAHQVRAKTSNEVEEIVIDESEDDEQLLPADHEQQQPLTQLPDSADEVTTASTPPRSRKRTRSAAHSNGDREAASTPSKTPVVVEILDTPVNSRTQKASRTITSPSPSQRTRSRAATNPPPVKDAAPKALPVSPIEALATATSIPPSPSQSPSRATAVQLAEEAPAAQVTVSQSTKTAQPSQEESPRPSAKTSAPSQEVAPRQPKSMPRVRDASALAAAKSAKPSRVVSPRQPSSTSSPAEVTTPSTAELAIKSYFRTGVPYSIQQRVQQPRDEELLDFFRCPADEDLGPLHANRNHLQANDRSVDRTHPRSKQASAKAAASRWRGSEHGATGVL